VALPSGATSALAILGTLGITAVAVTGAAFALFRLLGDRWLSSKFNERLEKYKHAQQRELEQLRLSINTTLDRTVKLHQFEFDVLPELWTKLNEAYGHVVSLTSPLQSYPDLNRLDDRQLNDFLDKSELAEWQKDDLRSSTDKVKDYTSMRFWQSLRRVEEKFTEFNRYFITKGIFIQEDIKSKIVDLRAIMQDALLEKELEEQDPNPRSGRWEKGRRLRKEGEDRLNAIGSAIQQRLWQTAALQRRDGGEGA
jgi:hypothetical protein